MKILNFGSCNIDSVYKVAGIVKPGETVASEDLAIHAGGKGLNQSIAVARSGSAVYHAGCIGSDGGFLKELLEDSGADTTYLKVTDVPTGHAVIQVDSAGENSIIIYKGANGAVTEEYVDFVLDGFEAGDILILQNEISSVPYIVDEAYRRGIRAVFNPSPINSAVQGVDLSKVYLLVVNEIEAKALSGASGTDEICDYFNSAYPEMRLVLTLGKKGSVYSFGDERVRCGAYPAKAVDTTGAGDTFLGYFVSAFARTGDAAYSLDMAAAAAALAVTKDGAAEAIPTVSQVEEFKK